MNSVLQSTLLLVEDEALIALNEQRQLENKGYKVIIAATGEEALLIVGNKSAIDLVLLDIDLGSGLDGTEVAQQILKGQDIPIVFLSSHIEPEVVNKTEKITSYGYVVKNSGITVLDASIKMAFKLFNAKKRILETEIIKDALMIKRELAEQILSVSETRYRRLFETAQDGILILDEESGKIVDVNPYLISMLGFSKEQFAEKSIWEIGAFKDLVANKDKFVELQAKEYVRYENLPLETAGGKKIQVEFVSNVYLVDNRKVIQCNIRNITDRKVAEDKAERLLKEKELLLKEVHHRIKNNMYTISALLSLQAQASNNPAAKAVLEDAVSRIQSMMVLYGKLFESRNFQSTSIAGYLSSLLDQIMASFPGRNALKVEKALDDFEMDAERLLPLGIILNELITNSMKYAFADGQEGLISISATLRGNLVCIGVSDNGKGIPESIDFQSTSGFGLMLVRELTKQLRGTIRIERGAETTFALEFARDPGSP